MTAPVFYVRGGDPVLRGNALDELLDELLGSDDRTLALEDHTVPGRATDGEGESGAEARAAVVGAALNAALSPPFMTERRVVVVRDVGHLTASDVEPFAAYLTDPLPTTALVFVAGGGRVPAALTKAWKGAVDERGPATEDTGRVISDCCAQADIVLSADARQLLTEHLGDAAGRVPALVEVLASAYGEGAKLDADDVLPYIGEQGAVPIWQLTNAVETGDTATALGVLDRLLHVTSTSQPKPMHPLQVVATTQNWLRRLARLDDPAIRGEQDAVAALGGKVKAYPAKKAWTLSRSLGTDGIRQAYELVWRADLDCKGASGAAATTVVEVMIVRLTRLVSSVSSRTRSPSSSGARRGERRRSYG